MTKRVPLSALKKIAKDLDKDQIILLAWDKTSGITHVATYGKTITDCEQAAIGGNRIKKFLGWPEELCNTMPRRLKKKSVDKAKE